MTKVTCPLYAFMLEESQSFCLSYCGSNLVRYELKSMRCYGAHLIPRAGYKLVESYAYGYFYAISSCMDDPKCAVCSGTVCTLCASGYKYQQGECVPECSQQCAEGAVCTPGGVCERCPDAFVALNGQCVPDPAKLCKSVKTKQMNSLCACTGAYSGELCEKTCLGSLIDSRYGCASETCLTPIQCFGRSLTGCVQTPIGYVCYCVAGYTGFDCEQCDNGYLPNSDGTLCSNKCAAVDNCAQCNEGACVKCEHGYELSVTDGKLYCNKQDICTNCKRCENGHCIECESGLFSIGSTCVAYSKFYGCKEWNTLGACIQCKLNYRYDYGVCRKYSDAWSSTGWGFLALGIFIFVFVGLRYNKKMRRMAQIYKERLDAKEKLKNMNK